MLTVQNEEQRLTAQKSEFKKAGCWRGGGAGHDNGSYVHAQIRDKS